MGGITCRGTVLREVETEGRRAGERADVGRVGEITCRETAQREGARRQGKEDSLKEKEKEEGQKEEARDNTRVP